MKKILFLTQIVPFPPDAGPKVKTWHVLRYLVSQGHQITLATFVRPDEEQYVSEIEKLGVEVFQVPIRRSRIADVGFLIRSYLSNRSFLIERDHLPAMSRLIEQLLAKGTFDVVHADQFTMPQFIPLGNTIPGKPIRIFDAHNANWSVIGRLKANAPFYLKVLFEQEQRRIKKYEGRIVNSFEYTLAVSDIDRELLLEAAQSTGGSKDVSSRVISIPIAVDTQALQPVERAPNSLRIVTLGTLHYQPNADGIRWFLQEVLPIIRKELPGSKLTIIGKNPPADFVKLSEQDDHIHVAGYVSELTPYMEESAIMVVPVRTGGGMRVRILEAFARGMPVVTTTTGLEGIDAKVGEDVLVADQPEDFAKKVIQLLCDPVSQESLARNGRRLAEMKYNWQSVFERLKPIY